MSILPRGSLASFMSNTRNTLQSAIIKHVASATLFAYIGSSAPSSTPFTNPSINRHQPTYQYPPLYIPVISALSRNVRGRPDLTAVLQHANLRPEHLITLDNLETEPPAGLDPDNTSELQPKFTRLILMGQTKLTGQLSPGYESCVAGYIDNNGNRSDVPKETSSEPRITTKAGSSSSLVVNNSRTSWNELSTGGSTSAVGSAQDDAAVGFDEVRMRQTWDARVVKLALAEILVNTKNLTEKEQTTEQDIMASEYLEAKIALSVISRNRDTFFKTLG